MSQTILIRPDGRFRGPFTHDEPIKTGEVPFLLTESVHQSLDLIRRENPDQVVVFEGGQFVVEVSDNRKLRKAFKEANASDAVALFFKPILEAAETLHRDGKKARAKKLIQDYPYPDAATKAVRDAILAIL